jgi:prolyl-tRNA synthetase
MKFSKSKIKTLRQVAEPSKNANLLIRGGYIDQLSAGVYTFLPLGWKVLNKISEIVREEMDKIGGQEILMPVLHPKENWVKTGRWETLDVLYRFTSHYTKTEMALGATHEEVITPLAKRYISSYKDLPLFLYQIQTKFRDEKRAKSGILRGREFLMKDLYSFNADQAGLDDFYEKAKEAYVRVYKRLGLGDITYLTYASGGTFSKYSHEFQTVCEVGEDTIYLCEKCRVAINKEIIDEQDSCPECGGKNLKEVKGAEVGNIFKLGTKFSDTFDLTYSDNDDKKHPVVMGCYGIGISRLMGTIVEALGDDKGPIWPRSIAPFTVHLVSLDGRVKEAEMAYNDLVKEGIEVIWDDRDESTGVKLSDADLLGLPYRVIISNRTVDEGKLEVKLRAEKEAKFMTIKELISGLTK